MFFWLLVRHPYWNQLPKYRPLEREARELKETTAWFISTKRSHHFGLSLVHDADLPGPPVRPSVFHWINHSDTLARKVGLPIALSDSFGHPLVVSRQAATLFPQQFDQSQTGQSKFSDGDYYLWMKHPLPENNPMGLQIILAMSSKPLEQVFLVILHNWALAALVLLVTGSVVYFWLVKTIVKPLNRLVHAAEQVASGNLDIQISDPKSDEVGRLSNAFNKMTTGLREVDRAKGAFLAYVSHELRTPLTSIVGFAARIATGGRQNMLKH